MATNPIVRPVKGGQVKGYPYQGTHAVDFNKKGGSDNWESENAYDIYIPTGSPVYAVQSGVIGSQIGPSGKGGRFAGARVHLLVQGNEYYYGHLSRVSVKAGQRVKAGDIIGYTGEANGVEHLHFAARHDPNVPLGEAAPTGGSSVTSNGGSDDQSTQQMSDQMTAGELAAQDIGNAPVIRAVGPNTIYPNDVTQPQDQPVVAQPRSETWNRLTQLPGASPDTMRLAQLAGYETDAGA